MGVYHGMLQLILSTVLLYTYIYDMSACGIAAIIPTVAYLPINV